MEIIVNGEHHMSAAALNVAELLAQLGVDTQKMAIEINGVIVPRSLYALTLLSDGDQVEMIRFIGGG